MSQNKERKIGKSGLKAPANFLAWVGLLACAAMPPNGAWAGSALDGRRLAVEARARRIEVEITRIDGMARRDPNLDRAVLGDVAYPALESLVDEFRSAPDFDRRDALILTRLTQDLLHLDPGLYGNAAEIVYPLHDKPGFEALLSECSIPNPAGTQEPGRRAGGEGVPDLRPLPDENGLAAAGLGPVSEADVCALRDDFSAITRLGMKGNG